MRAVTRMAIGKSPTDDVNGLFMMYEGKVDNPTLQGPMGGM